MAQVWQIGKVARETGLSIHAIRFYARVGLLREPSRTAGGFRLYDQKSVSDLKFIQSAQERGFTLAEIRDLLVLRNRSTKACSRVKSLLQEKLASVRAKRRELEAMERGMSRDLVECQRALRRRHSGRAQPCPFLAELEEQG
jgi:MerR family mercuric resistance operon transcriptional regulator